MATWIKTELIGQKNADFDVRSGTGSETWDYLVYYDAEDADANAAIIATGIPAKGSQLGTTGAYAAKFRVVQEPRDPRIFRVSVTYETPQINQQQPQPPGTTKWNIQVQGATVARQETIQADL